MQFKKHAFLLALMGAAACGGAGDSDTDRDLERLRALGVFEVRYQVVDPPGGSEGCTGQPCPPTGPAPSSLNARAARRLAKLAAMAEMAAASMPRDPSAIHRIEANLELLRSLEIVDVGDFIRKQPANNPRCNDTPCQSDIDAAEQENEANAAALEAIARAAQSL
jgi:hypothetical protein